jgi:hypothetical protein
MKPNAKKETLLVGVGGNALSKWPGKHSGTALGINAQKPLAGLIRYVVADKKDPAFQEPSKPT